MLHKRSGYQTSFPYGDWIQIDSDPVEISASGRPTNVYQPYEVTVYTSDNTDASFDGKVSITLKGQNGATSYSTLLGQGSSDTGVFQVKVCSGHSSTYRHNVWGLSVDKSCLIIPHTV